MDDRTDRTTQRSWSQLRRRLTYLYLIVGVALLIISGVGHARLLSEVGKTFTWDMWFNTYGLALIAGIIWLLVGGYLLATSSDWSEAVEGITLLPPAMLFLLFSHWGNVQQALPADLVIQLLWIPSFALLGAGFIHLSLNYRPGASKTPRSPRLWIDGLPYLPLLALLAFDLSTLAFRGSVPTHIQFSLALGYAILGGLFSLATGLTSLLRIHRAPSGASLSEPARRRLSDLLILWIGAVGLGFGLGILPLLLTGQSLVPLPVFYVLAAAYPLVLLYAIRSLRLIDRLAVTLRQREEMLNEQQKTVAQLRQSNQELQEATSLLLYADAQLRSMLSQRIHDQPKQQALRIRSLLGHWQHKLRLETEGDPALRGFAQPVIEVLGRVRKISDELESDLRGLQLLIEDSHRRHTLGLRLHLEALIRDDLPSLHPESPLRIQPDLWALDQLSHELEQTPEGEKFVEAISYTVTQGLLNVYNHAGATFTTVRAARSNGYLELMITDDGHGFDVNAIPPEKTGLSKARLKARDAGGELSIFSAPRNQPQHGTTLLLRLPLPPSELTPHTGPLPESLVEEMNDHSL